MNKDIIGGVSPLKARKSKFKAGDVGKKATNTKAQDKSGFQRSGKESAGEGRSTKGRNYESFTGNTRLTDSMSIGTKDPSLISATRGKDNFGETKEFTGTEFKQDPSTKEVKIVSTDKEGKVVDEMGDACSKAYIAKHGDADCIAYKKYRKDNPVDRSKRKKVKVEYDTKNGQKYQQDYKVVDGKKIITKPWYPIN